MVKLYEICWFFFWLDFLGENHGFTWTDLDASKWLILHVPRRTSGSSSSVLACKSFS